MRFFYHANYRQEDSCVVSVTITFNYETWRLSGRKTARKVSAAMDPAATELEIVELKRTSCFLERREPYGHFNFLVKCSDGTPTLFFAETHSDCTDESDVYLCCPLEENDNGDCFGCRKCGVDLRHPIVADYFGGHRDICTVDNNVDDEVTCFMD
uniref:DUF3615 domain-containing protein n=1 Tax=Leersia perrieri TaxID=77586 RepID=A0A0D9XM66_9ORYZ